MSKRVIFASFIILALLILGGGIIKSEKAAAAFHGKTEIIQLQKSKGFGFKPTTSTTSTPSCDSTQTGAYVEVLSPNGGEIFANNETITVEWLSCNIPLGTGGDLHEVYVSLVSVSTGNIIAFQNIPSGNNGLNSLQVTLDLSTALPANDYKTGISVTTNVAGEGDFGDGTFEIYSAARLPILKQLKLDRLSLNLSIVQTDVFLENLFPNDKFTILESLSFFDFSLDCSGLSEFNKFMNTGKDDCMFNQSTNLAMQNILNNTINISNAIVNAGLGGQVTGFWLCPLNELDQYGKCKKMNFDGGGGAPSTATFICNKTGGTYDCPTQSADFCAGFNSYYGKGSCK